MEEPTSETNEDNISKNAETDEKIENTANDPVIDLKPEEPTASTSIDPISTILEIVDSMPVQNKEEIKSSVDIQNSSDECIVVMDDVSLPSKLEEKPAELDINLLCDNTFAAIAAISRNDEPADVEMEDLTEILPSPAVIETALKIVEVEEAMDIEIISDKEPDCEVIEDSVAVKDNIPTISESSLKPEEGSEKPEITITQINDTKITESEKMEVDGNISKAKISSIDEDDDDIIFIENDEKNPLDGDLGAASIKPTIIADLPDVSVFLVNKKEEKLDVIPEVTIIKPQDLIKDIKEQVSVQNLLLQQLNSSAKTRVLGTTLRSLKKNTKPKPSSSKMCINPNCSRTCEKFCNSPNFIFAFYYVTKGKKKQVVCDDCFDFAVEKCEQILGHCCNNEAVLAVKTPAKPDLVEIIDSDEEQDPIVNSIEKNEEAVPLDAEIIEFLSNVDMTAMMERVWAKVDIIKQYDLCNEFVNLKAQMNELNLTKLMVSLKLIEGKSNCMYNKLYSVHKYDVRELPALDLDSGLESSRDPIHRIESLNIRLDPKQSPNKMRNVLQQQRTQQSQMQEKQNQISHKNQIRLRTANVAASASGNMTYYAVRTKVSDSWAPCRLLDTIFVSGSIVYKVQFLGVKVNSPSIRTVSGKELAYGSISEKLEIGTRVLAEFYRDGSPNTGLKERLPGVVGEKLSNYNSRRYLVFCDDGGVQYVPFTLVHPIVEVSENVWNDVHVNLRQFIKEFLETDAQNSTRQRPLLNVCRGNRIVTEKNGIWKNATILDTDASLVKLQYVDDNTCEWFYRGSKRLGPVYTNSLVQKTGGMPKKVNKTSSVEMTTVDEGGEGSSVEPFTKRSVAKKSTSKPRPPENLPPVAVNVPASSQPGQNPVKVKILNDDNIYVDDPARVARIRHFTPRVGICAEKYVAHVCNPGCAPNNLLNLALYPPLAKPLLFSWERQVNKQKSFKSITYKAPCGRRLRNINEVHRYLNDTKFFRLNVDNFDFDMTIQVLANYEVEKSLCGLFVEDFSKGKEAMKIQVVNAFDSSGPNLQRYENARTPTEGVNINTDKEFLCSCDCTDDCLDKTKCACFLMTIEGAKYKNIMEQEPHEISYVYKRLLHHVPTGIYECNKGCQCNSRCLNKVVQQPIQVKLQIYRTKNRGWGLQCLHDVAKGTFICIYAGLLYTEKTANSLCSLPGVEHGDEYFAELDYIESTQLLKDGYESDVAPVPEDGENSDENDDSDSDYDEIGVGPHARKSTAQHGREIVTRSGKKPAAKASTSTASDLGNVAEGGDSDSDEEMKEEVAPSELEPSRPVQYKRFRKYFGAKERVYIMDAKTTGNVGRYFNHSCSPNLFVQSVFVDTQDVRFPWIAFFAQKAIKAGEELTWNYNYELNSVPNKVLFCKCSSKNCRGRIL